ncbi:hypothetical protein DB346_18605 [Verrucomicrobia bacterium LW23]|nr:hypothetical protein DB346_18605 [Verrucomicrobia bacterium LW23]
MKLPRFLAGAFAAAGVMALVVAAGAQSPPIPEMPKPTAPAGTPADDAEAIKNDKVKVSVTRMGLADKGAIVFCVRLESKKREHLLLGSVAEQEKGQDKVFTMERCVLEESKTGRKLKPLQDLPTKPFFGPMALVTGIRKGGWIELGVAFPRLPPPPADNQGKPVEYRLTVPVPGVDPISVMIPEQYLGGGKASTAATGTEPAPAQQR